MSRLRTILRQNPTFTDSDSIAALCQPLSHLGLVYFSYVHINQQHEMAALVNYPEFARFYLEQGYQQHDIHRLSVNQPEQIIIWDYLERQNNSKKMHDDFRAFGRGHTCTIIRQDETGTSYFNFAAKEEDVHINDLYLHHRDALYRFIQYFLDKLSRDRRLSQIFNYRLALKPDEGGYDLVSSKETFLINQFYQQTETQRVFLTQDAYLTQAELACLQWLFQGKTIEETAIILGLSPRTVKAHIHASKQKLNCQNLFQLGAKVSSFFKGGVG